MSRWIYWERHLTPARIARACRLMGIPAYRNVNGETPLPDHVSDEAESLLKKGAAAGLLKVRNKP